MNVDFDSSTIGLLIWRQGEVRTGSTDALISCGGSLKFTSAKNILSCFWSRRRLKERAQFRSFQETNFFFRFLLFDVRLRHSYQSLNFQYFWKKSNYSPCVLVRERNLILLDISVTFNPGEIMQRYSNNIQRYSNTSAG